MVACSRIRYRCPDDAGMRSRIETCLRNGFNDLMPKSSRRGRAPMDSRLARHSSRSFVRSGWSNDIVSSTVTAQPNSFIRFFNLVIGSRASVIVCPDGQIGFKYGAQILPLRLSGAIQPLTVGTRL